MTWGLIASAAITTVGGALLSSGSSGGQQQTQQSQALSDAQARLANSQADIGNAQWQRYLQLFAPVEQDYLDRAKGLDSFANQNKDAQQAAATVAGSFAGARNKLNQNAGVDPGSQAYLEAENNLNLNEAATSAAAQTGARQMDRDKAQAALTDAVSLGKGLPAQASSTLASAGSGLGSAARLLAQQGEYAQGVSNRGINSIGNFVGGITNSSGFKNWANGSGTQAGGGYGSVPGAYTDGSGNTYNNPSAYVGSAPATSDPAALQWYD